MSILYPDKVFYLFDKLIENPGCLYKMETSNPGSLYTRLNNYRDITGKAVYHWQKDQGLRRSDIPNIYAPRTENLTKALQHISLSIHFGIYLFTDIDKGLYSPKAMELIQELVKKQESQKLLIFADTKLDIPPQIDELFVSIRNKPTSADKGQPENRAIA